MTDTNIHEDYSKETSHDVSSWISQLYVCSGSWAMVQSGDFSFSELIGAAYGALCLLLVLFFALSYFVPSIGWFAAIGVTFLLMAALGLVASQVDD